MPRRKKTEEVQAQQEVPQEQELTIEETFERLQALLARMEEEDVSLEESFDCYEQGMKLLRACNDKIEAVTGVRPTLFRCPYGEYDDHVIQAVSSLGMTAVQWDVDSLDWKGISADEIQRRVLDRVQPGSIVLFHNAAENTPEALPGILESLISNGYRIVPITQLLLQGDCFIDNTGRQCRN